MFIDSHCHINFPELKEKMDDILLSMEERKITHALCVSVTLDKFPEIRDLAGQYKHIFASVTHNLITEAGVKRLQDSPINALMTTDTVDTKFGPSEKIWTLSVAQLLAKAIYNTHKFDSVSSLFEIEEKPTYSEAFFCIPSIKRRSRFKFG